jgi:hypothetical protein
MNERVNGRQYVAIEQAGNDDDIPFSQHYYIPKKQSSYQAA